MGTGWKPTLHGVPPTVLLGLLSSSSCSQKGCRGAARREEPTQNRTGRGATSGSRSQAELSSLPVPCCWCSDTACLPGGEPSSAEVKRRLVTRVAARRLREGWRQARPALALSSAACAAGKAGLLCHHLGREMCRTRHSGTGADRKPELGLGKYSTNPSRRFTPGKLLQGPRLVPSDRPDEPNGREQRGERCGKLTERKDGARQ